MNPYAAYQQHTSVGWTRIDLILALYEGAISRLETAIKALRSGDAQAAKPLLDRVKVVVAAMATGVSAEEGELADNFRRLYEFVLHGLEMGKVENVAGALRVLRVLREGFEQIRPEAVQLERSGHLPPLDAVNSLLTIA